MSIITATCDYYGKREEDVITYGTYDYYRNKERTTYNNVYNPDLFIVIDLEKNGLSIESIKNKALLEIVKQAKEFEITKSKKRVEIETIDDKIDRNLMAKLYRYREMLDNVSDIQVSLKELYEITDIPEWYKPIFTVCKLIWNDWIAFDSEGNHRLLELNDRSRLCYIWQKYLLHFSQKYFNQLIVSNPTYIDGWKIDKNGNKQHRQRHLDLLINDKYNKKAVIADAKYYNSGDGDSVSNRDQVNTYCDIFYNNHMDYKITGLLLIASDRYTGHIGGKDGNNGIEINSYTININQDKDNMESDIINILESYLNKTKLEES